MSVEVQIGPGVVSLADARGVTVRQDGACRPPSALRPPRCDRLSDADRLVGRMLDRQAHVSPRGYLQVLRLTKEYKSRMLTAGRRPCSLADQGGI